MLVKTLMAVDKKERAKEIANSMMDQTDRPAQNTLNRIFDVVLNLNSLNSKPKADGKNIRSDKTDLMQQIKEAKKGTALE